MKKSYKRRLMENDDDLKECVKFSKINKKEKKNINIQKINLHIYSYIINK